jgi:hypothetical protein
MKRNPGRALPPIPDFAELVIGPATSGRTRWLNPGRAIAELSLRGRTIFAKVLKPSTEA